MKIKLILTSLTTISVVSPTITMISCGATRLIESDDIVTIRKVIAELKKLTISSNNSDYLSFEELDLLRRSWATDIDQETLASMGVLGVLPKLPEQMSIKYTMIDIESTRVDGKFPQYALELMVAKDDIVSKEKALFIIGSKNVYRSSNSIIANNIFNEVSKITSSEKRKTSNQLDALVSDNWSTLTATKFDALGLDGQLPQFSPDSNKEIKFVLKKNGVSEGLPLTYTLSLAGYFIDAYSTQVHNLIIAAINNTDKDVANKIFDKVQQSLKLNTSFGGDDSKIENLDKHINSVRTPFDTMNNVNSIPKAIGIDTNTIPVLQFGEEIVFTFTTLQEEIGKAKKYEIKIWGRANNTLSNDFLTFQITSSDTVVQTNQNLANDALLELDQIKSQFNSSGIFKSPKIVNDIEKYLSSSREVLTRDMIVGLGLVMNNDFNFKGGAKLMYTFTVTLEALGAPREYAFTIWGEKSNFFTNPVKLKLLSSNNSANADSAYIQTGSAHYPDDDRFVYTGVEPTYFGATNARTFDETSLKRVTYETAEKYKTYSVKTLDDKIVDGLALQYSNLRYFSNGSDPKKLVWSGEVATFPTEFYTELQGEKWGKWSRLKVNKPLADLDVFLTKHTDETLIKNEGILSATNIVSLLGVNNADFNTYIDSIPKNMYQVFWLTKALNSAGTAYTYTLRMRLNNSLFTYSLGTTDGVSSPNRFQLFNSKLGYTLFPLNYEADGSATYQMNIFTIKGLSVGFNFKNILLTTYSKNDAEYENLNLALNQVKNENASQDNLAIITNQITFETNKQLIANAIGGSGIDPNIVWNYEYVDSYEQNISVKVLATINNKTISKIVKVVGT